jgi:hypothetical protein
LRLAAVSDLRLQVSGQVGVMLASADLVEEVDLSCRLLLCQDPECLLSWCGNALLLPVLVPVKLASADLLQEVEVSCGLLLLLFRLYGFVELVCRCCAALVRCTEG